MQSLEEIIVGCKMGKQNAQKCLFERYSDRMFGVCLYYTRDTEEAEDILHDGFIRIFENIGKYEDGNFEAWMRKIFVNLALMQYRRNKRMQLVEDIAEIQEFENHFYQEKPMEYNELILLVKTLPPQYQLVFNLYAIEGYMHKEIAEMLNIDEGTSKSNLARARKILQAKLKTNLV